MRGAILVLLVSGCGFAQQGSLEGTAIHAVPREPLSNVHVQLRPTGGLAAAYGAMSDRTGHFSIATVRPGTYILAAGRAGFLFVPAKRTTYYPTIKPGEALTGFQLEMTPCAVISGRVVDEAADPVQGVMVDVMTPGGTAGYRQETDDRGEFRLTGAAGKYYVQAWPKGDNGGDRPETRSDGTSEAIYAPTFYPSSVRKERGTVVEAVAGKEVGGIEIRLARGLAISGVVSGFPKGTARGDVLMEFGESAKRIIWSYNTSPSADGRFRFDGLPPGFFRLRASYDDGATQLASRSREGQLGSLEIANVELVLAAGVELSGTLKMEGEAAGAAAPKRTVRLDQVGGRRSLRMTGGEVGRDGSFRIAGIMPDKYRVKVEGLPENAYMKTLEIDGTMAANGIADFSNVTRGASAKVTIGRNGAQISGQVLDANGERMLNRVVMILLARDPSEFEMADRGFTVQAPRAAPDGKYTIQAVAPGKYRLFALDVLELGGGNSDLEVVTKLFERGEEIEFKEGERIVKDLKVIRVEGPNAKPKA